MTAAMAIRHRVAKATPIVPGQLIGHADAQGPAFGAIARTPDGSAATLPSRFRRSLPGTLERS